MVRILALLAGLLACGGKEPTRPEPVDPPERVAALYAEAVDRLEREHVERGWVVSRRPDGSAEHVGDALIWSGVALGVLPCDRGQAIEANLIDVLSRHGGALVRFEPLGDYAHDGRHVSLDGALGLWHGLSRRLDCPGAQARWQAALRAHAAYLEGSGGRLHPGATALVPPGVDYVPALLAHRLGLRGAPRGDHLELLHTAVTAWALATVAARKACYRLHLGYLALSAVEALGGAVRRAGFCRATAPAGIPLLDHYCDRGDLAGWIDAFEWNAWEHRHQRCAGWERPDGDGDATPAIDLIQAIKAVYAI